MAGKVAGNLVIIKDPKIQVEQDAGKSLLVVDMVDCNESTSDGFVGDDSAKKN